MARPAVETRRRPEDSCEQSRQLVSWDFMVALILFHVAVSKRMSEVPESVTHSAPISCVAPLCVALDNKKKKELTVLRTFGQYMVRIMFY